MRVESSSAIAYYCQEAREQNWSIRQLERYIKSQDFQRLLSTKTGQTQNTSNSAHLEFIKDPYVLEFLRLPETGKLKESRLEQAIIDELQNGIIGVYSTQFSTMESPSYG
jgi:predicted nuclease of restriction endonuclease-like (RecB) superfamily